MQSRAVTRCLLTTMLLLGAIADATAQKVSLSNNLLYDAWLTPNLRVGYSLSQHWSTGLTAGFRPWPTDDETSKKWRHLLLSPEIRYWKDTVSVHHFFGANLIYSHYNVAEVKFPFGLYKSVRDERRQGDLYALGVFYGYSWPLGRHWNIEAAIGAAVGFTKYDRFQCGHCGNKIGNDTKLFAMPQAALNIVYNIPGRPAKMVAADEPAVKGFEPVVRAVPGEDAKVINEACELLTTDCSDCHHEALRLLLTVADDERAQNALGVAYLLCGMRQEALDCFRQAAARGNADAQENLRHLEGTTQ